MSEVNELIQLSEAIWNIQRYFQTVTGPANLEMDQTPAQLLAQIAIMVDKTIIKIIPPEQAITPPLRRAKAYVSCS